MLIFKMTGQNNEEKDERRPLRSGRSAMKSFVRFVNQTNRFVDIVWLNYEGARVKYKTLQPGHFVDVNTFVGHPWIFRDSDTGDHMVVHLREVFETTHSYEVPQTRKIINITIPVYTLKERSLQVIRRLVNRDRIQELDLPQSLRDEMQVMCDITGRRERTNGPNSPVAGPSREIH